MRSCSRVAYASGTSGRLIAAVALFALRLVTGQPWSRAIARLLASLSWLLLVGLTWSTHALAQLEYSKTDLATVRVFALRGVDSLDVLVRRPGMQPILKKIAALDAGHGSGVKVSSDGLVLTAAHVVDGAGLVAVKLPGSKLTFPARVVYQNDEWDLAFLAIPKTHENFRPLPTTAPTLRIRQTVDAIGYPVTANRSRPQSTRGIVSGLMPNGDVQLGISVNPGNSGGPLIDENENLVGVVVARGDIEQGIQGIGVAVGVHRILQAYQQVNDAGLFKTARQELTRLTDVDWSAAAFVSSLVLKGSWFEELRNILEGRSRSALGPALEEEIARIPELTNNSAAADLYALAGAFHWNRALALFHKDEPAWRVAAKKGIELCRKARQKDSEVDTRSPFVRVVLDLGDSDRSTTTLKLSPAGSPGGFRIGADVVEAQRSCQTRAFRFENAGNTYACSGVPRNSPLPATSQLKFCNGRLCEVRFVHELSAQRRRKWLDRWQKIRSRHIELYGSPKVENKIPQACQKKLLDCFDAGTAALLDSWEWSGRTLQLAVGRWHGKPCIVVTHRVK